MSWNHNDGPWGSSNNKSSNQGSWSQKPNNKSNGASPGPEPSGPDFNDFITYIMRLLSRLSSGQGGPASVGAIILVILAIIWCASGVYQVGANQAGIVMRFGAFNRMESPGLHYHSPYPIEYVILPNVTSQNAIEIGFRSNDNGHSVPEESMMLTQDENIIDVEFTVFWRISDIQKYLFQIRQPENTIKMAAESAMREVIGQNKLQFELTDGRSQIAEETRQRLQKLMDSYNAGVMISQINLQTVAVPDQVKAAFQDVVNAKLDQERYRNEATTHANEVVPKAKGEAAKITQQALAYRDQKIAIAQGDADRFKEVLTAYNESKEVTLKRLYLETMETVLGSSRKIILDKGSSSAVPYLPLQDFVRARTGGNSEGDKQ